MNALDYALSLAARGFHVFPIRPGDKRPAFEGWQDAATTQEGKIRQWFDGRDYNVGISTSRFGEDKALVVVDVDTKEGKHGDESLLQLELSGCELPVTLEHSTPSGGRHIIYLADEPLRQGVDVLGVGLDIRSRGGYIVGPGSTVDGGRTYAQINGHGSLAPAPAWLRARLGADRRSEPADRAALAGVDADRAAARALTWLPFAPAAVQGEGGDLATFKVAARLKDLGCSREQAIDLLLEHWNPRCEPPWDDYELAIKVNNAYGYGREPQGSSAPEAVFPPAPPADDAPAHPFENLNREYAFIKKGAFVIQETTDAKGQFSVQHLSQDEMHGWHLNKVMQIGKTTKPISKWWMEWPERREFEGVVFTPEQDPGPRWYNLWRGFTVEPKAGRHASVNAFLEHALVNVCGGDKKLCHWLIGYFAHMIQRPSEKPLVALVFKGDKGVGKNALVERVGALLGPHFLVADDERYLLGNFNSHLESNLFFVLDEAAWAGDKRAEGKLKGLITGTRHNIERKGREPYQVDNLCRIAIIGNEAWIVPASSDERRFAVFSVGDGRKQDRKFFHDMRVGMEQGGYAHLLHFLQTYDISDVDVNDAPATAGLIEQKHASLDCVQEWWLDCIANGEIVGGDWSGAWPENVPVHRLRDAFVRWARNRNIRSRLPEERGFGRILKKIAPSMGRHRMRSDDGDRSYQYHNPGLDQLRKDWEVFIGGSISWTE